MSDDSGVQFVGARSRKRPHRQMSETSTTPGPSSHPETSQSPATNPPQNGHPPRQVRYAGDGLDFRRPVMSSPPGTGSGSVIDLTNEPDTSPRRVADVVDLEEDEDEGENEDEDEDEEDIVILNHTVPPSSPEVEFVGSTTRPPDPTPLHPPLHPPPQPPLPQAFGTSTGFGRSHLWQWLRGHPRFAGSAFSGRLAFGRQLPWPTRIFGPPPQEDTLFIGDDADGGVDLTVDLDVDLSPSGSRSEQRAPVDTYKPPSPPPEGFTRNAGEDDVVVCPNCDEELGMGDEIKQQIWAVKNCGHVYCGECARNRSLSKAKKTPQRVKPFSKCQAADCGKPSTPSCLFHPDSPRSVSHASRTRPTKDCHNT